MSHSFKKHAFAGVTTSKSEKKDKRLAHRRLRTLTNSLMKEISEGAEIDVLPVIKEVSDIYNFDKDGKIFYHEGSEYVNEVIRK